MGRSSSTSLSGSRLRASHRAAAALGLVAALAPAAPLAGQARVAGIVVDSAAGLLPLPGATVQLVRADDPRWVRSTVADSLGRWAVADVPPGRYLLGFLHARLDDLGLRPPLRPLEVTGAAEQRAVVAIPAARTIAAAHCRRTRLDSAALLLGRLRHAEAPAGVEPTLSGEVRVEWSDWVLDHGRVREERRSARARTDDDGRFVICGVPAAPVLVRGVAGPLASGRVELTLPAGGLLQRDLWVAAPAAAAPSATLRGVVRAEGRPHAGARVVVVAGGERTVVTDAEGRFALDSLAAGTHALEVRAVGFLPQQLAVDLRAGREATVDVRLAERVRSLAPSVVRGDARRGMAGFLERAALGHGHFVTPAMIAERGTRTVTDLLRTVPMLRLRPSDGHGTIISMRGALPPHGDCAPAVYVDGTYILDGGFELERYVAAAELGGIEVYSSASVPPEYQRGMCGSILIWTRPPG